MIKVLIVLDTNSDDLEFYFETLSEANEFIRICLENGYTVEVSKALERK